MKIPSLSTIVLLAASASAVAQTKFCIGGDLDQLSPAQMTACQAKSADLKAEVRLHGAPEGWHFVVICDETGWSDYASFVGNHAAQIMKATENTDRDLRFTFVRGSRIEVGNRSDLALVLASVRKDMPETRGAKPIPAARPSTSRPLLTASEGPLPTFSGR